LLFAAYSYSRIAYGNLKSAKIVFFPHKLRVKGNRTLFRGEFNRVYKEIGDDLGQPLIIRNQGFRYRLVNMNREFLFFFFYAEIDHSDYFLQHFFKSKFNGGQLQHIRFDF